MPFGISFGAKSQKSKTTTNFDKTEATNQAQSGTTNSSGTTASSQTGSQTGSSTGTSTQTQKGTQAQQGSQSGVTQQQSSMFGDNVLGGLESAVMDLFDSTKDSPHIGDFDAQKFIDGGMAKAKDTQAVTLEDSLNKTFADIGGTAETNSMAAILANQLRGSAGANLAGIESQLTAQANDITRSNALAESQVAGQSQNFLAQLLSALKGGKATTTGTEQTATSQTQQSENTGTNVTSEQTAQNTSQQATQTQQLIEMMNQLLVGTTHTTGTETSKTKGSSFGGGVSASG